MVPRDVNVLESSFEASTGGNRRLGPECLRRSGDCSSAKAVKLLGQSIPEFDATPWVKLSDVSKLWDDWLQDVLQDHIALHWNVHRLVIRDLG
jgi:hypothetical protein